MSIVVELFELILFKRKAKDISYSSEAALICFVAFLGTSYFQLSQSQILQAPLLFAIVQAGALALIFFLVLSASKKQMRFIQMATAIFGISAILQFAGLLLAVLPGLIVVGTLLSVLNIVLMIVILRDTLEIGTVRAIFIAIASHFAVGTILFFMFPEFYDTLQQAIQASQEVSN